MKSTTLQIRLGKDRGDRIVLKYLEQNKEGSSFTKEAKRLLIECVLDKLREQYGNNDLEEIEIYKRFILNETNQQEQIPSRVDYQDLKWVNDNQEKHEKYGENENEEFNDDDDCNITDI